MLKSLIIAHLPPGLLRSIRQRRADQLKQRMARLPKLSEAGFSQLLVEQMGVQTGDTLFIHSSVQRLNLGFSHFRLPGLLHEAVGEQGTLLFPTSHISGQAAAWLESNQVFDVARTPTTLGLLNEMARRTRGAVRSGHPTNSVVALGKHAEPLLGEHCDSLYPCGDKSPYYKICALNGKILGLGVSTEVLTFVHVVEDLMGKQFPLRTRLDKTWQATVKAPDGSLQSVETLAHHPQVLHRDIPGYIRKHISDEACRDFIHQGVDHFVADANRLLSEMDALARRGITIYNALARERHHQSTEQSPGQNASSG